VLLAVAAPSEAEAVARGIASVVPHAPDTPDTPVPFAKGPIEGSWVVVALSTRLDLVQTGVGKSNASGAVARVLDPSRHAGVISLGVAGALPGSGLSIGDVVVAEAAVFADEGILKEDGFQDCWAMGFPQGGYPDPAVPVHAPWTEMLRTLGSVARIATVSTCSGTDALASEIARRTRAGAEAMEGAAVGHVAHRLGVPFAEVRVISNSTGDRRKQVWDLKAALRVLSDVAARL
jgi:futalosine hydrolase